MIENVESLLKTQITTMTKAMVEMLLSRLEVPETSEPKEVTKDFANKLSGVIGSYVLASFQDYDETISSLLYKIKQLEDKIGDEDTSGTILYRLKNIDDNISSIQESITSLGNQITSLTERVTALENTGGA